MFRQGASILHICTTRTYIHTCLLFVPGIGLDKFSFQGLQELRTCDTWDTASPNLRVDMSPAGDEACRCVYFCVRLCVYAYICIYIYIYIYIYIRLCVDMSPAGDQACWCVYIYVRLCVYMCVCVCVYI